MDFHDCVCELIDLASETAAGQARHTSITVNMSIFMCE